MLKAKRRPDGRKFDEVRNIDSEVGILPRTHGSALFQRGETQALVTATLGTKDDEQRIELLDPTETSKRWMLHYNFPPFSVGEVGFMRGAGRREIGHGALAERALAAVIPDDKTVPLHHALRQRHPGIERFQLHGLGVRRDPQLDGRRCTDLRSRCRYRHGPRARRQRLRGPHRHRGRRRSLRRHGLQSRRHQGRHHRPPDGHQGDQRHPVHPHGSAGAGPQGSPAHPGSHECRDLRTAYHDVPVRPAHLHHADPDRQDPRTDRTRRQGHPRHRRSHRLQDRRGRQRRSEDLLLDGTAADRCIQMVTDICAVAEIGKTYLGKVVRIVDFGAFVEIFPGTDGLLHITEIAENRIKQVRDELNEGDQILVKVLGLEGNKIKLSRKAILKEQRDKLKAEEPAKA